MCHDRYDSHDSDGHFKGSGEAKRTRARAHTGTGCWRAVAGMGDCGFGGGGRDRWREGGRKKEGEQDISVTGAPRERKREREREGERGSGFSVGNMPFEQMRWWAGGRGRGRTDGRTRYWQLGVRPKLRAKCKCGGRDGKMFEQF